MIFVNRRRLRICNGRLEPTGSFTYCGANGSSSIDYLLARQCDFSLIKSFEIMPLNEFSDHTPLCFTLDSLNLNHQTNITDDNCSRVYWCPEKRDLFRRALIEQLPRLNVVSSQTGLVSKENVNSCVSNFVKILNNVAEPMFSRHASLQSKRGIFSQRPICKMSEWFDTDCREAKMLYLQAIENYNNCKSNHNREILLERKRDYKNRVRKKEENVHECENERN